MSFAGALERVGDALPVELLVVEDVDLRDAEDVLHVLERRCAPGCRRRRRRGRSSARRRVVLVRLARLRARAALRQALVRVRRADHRQRRRRSGSGYRSPRNPSCRCR